MHQPRTPAAIHDARIQTICYFLISYVLAWKKMTFVNIILGFWIDIDEHTSTSRSVSHITLSTLLSFASMY